MAYLTLVCARKEFGKLIHWDQILKHTQQARFLSR